MEKRIQHSIFYSHTPAEVWEYLTKPELIAQWLMPNDFEPIVGYDFEFTTRPMPAFDFDGHIYCKVLEVVPFKKLSYSWKGGPGGGKITMDSIVTFTLAEKDNGTELLLDHSGFRILENADIFSAMNTGWLQNIQKIATLLNTVTNGSTSI